MHYRYLQVGVSFYSFLCFTRLWVMMVFTYIAYLRLAEGKAFKYTHICISLFMYHYNVYIYTLMLVLIGHLWHHGGQGRHVLPAKHSQFSLYIGKDIHIHEHIIKECIWQNHLISHVSRSTTKILICTFFLWKIVFVTPF